MPYDFLATYSYTATGVVLTSFLAILDEFIGNARFSGNVGLLVRDFLATPDFLAI